MTLMFQVPRGRVLSCEWEVTDSRHLSEGGDKPDGLTSGASGSREQKCRFVARPTVEEREAGSPTHLHEHDSRRARIPLVLSGASDQRDTGVNVPPGARLEIEVSQLMTQGLWDRRAFEGEDVQWRGRTRGGVR